MQLSPSLDPLGIPCGLDKAENLSRVKRASPSGPCPWQHFLKAGVQALRGSLQLAFQSGAWLPPGLLSQAGRAALPLLLLHFPRFVIRTRVQPKRGGTFLSLRLLKKWAYLEGKNGDKLILYTVEQIIFLWG